MIDQHELDMEYYRFLETNPSCHEAAMHMAEFVMFYCNQILYQQDEIIKMLENKLAQKTYSTMPPYGQH